jgi:hypothetical protein
VGGISITTAQRLQSASMIAKARFVDSMSCWIVIGNTREPFIKITSVAQRGRTTKDVTGKMREATWAVIRKKTVLNVASIIKLSRYITVGTWHRQYKMWWNQTNSTIKLHDMT